MTKTLLVPDHVLDSIKSKETEETKPSSAYVEKSEKVLDPSLVSKNLKERLPQPTGWRLLVMPYMGKAATEGGILIPDAVRDREALATVVAYAGARFKIEGGEVRIINDDEVIATILEPDDIKHV